MNDKIRPAIVVFPGSNCDKDMELVLREIYELDPELLWHTATSIPNHVTHLILPGGFSFGDYLRAGALAAVSPIMTAIKQFALAGQPLLGVCNGFQILCEAQLLPGVLLKNHHDRFVCSIEPLTWFGAKKRISEPLELNLPIAHREGRYYADQKTIKELKDEQRIALVYNQKNESGDALVNGASECIAGIIGGPCKNIFGLMPHPERMAQENMLGRDGCVILQDFLFG